MMRRAGPLPLLPVVLLCAACATPSERVVLLPNADGRPSAVIIEAAGQRAVVETSWGEARVGKGGRVEHRQATAAEIEARFANVLAARPPRPLHFQLYFQFDSEDLTAPSAREVETMFSAIAGRPAPEVLVTGHTDTQGEADYNDALSLRRAQALRARLETRLRDAGLPAARVAVAGRGEREPLFATADETDEPRNRRVEISVR